MTSKSDAIDSERLAPLGLLASAISGRALQVAPGEPGEPAWTDGRTIFVAPDAGTRRQIEALAVQASLLAAGSLHPDLVRKLWRAALARRYLAVEGHRALAAIVDLLPGSLRPLIDFAVAARADSSAASLALALSREAIADPPESFGAIRTRPLLASIRRGSAASHAQAPLGRRNPVLAELARDDDEDRAAADLVSSPGGGGGAIGRWLRQLLTAVRRLEAGGSPGADAPTHRAQIGTRVSAHSTFSMAKAETLEAATREGGRTKYPEWDVHRRRYRPDWCSVQEIEPQRKHDAPFLVSDRYGLRRPLTRLGMGLERHRRQAQGDDLDIDAAIEARVELLAGSAPDEAFYVDNLRRRRDLSVLILLDVSGSVAEPGSSAGTVHEQQRAAAAALSVALHEIGDRVALYAYQSRGRSAVQLLPVKRFDDALDSVVMGRLHGLVPSAYSRLGAAIRHGAAVLEQRGGTPRRLLVVLTDGLAYDHGYEPEYGAADARRALAEARRRGTGCLCLSIGASTDAETLRRVFGNAAHAALPGVEPLGRVIGPLFRSALRSVELRRRA